MIENTRKQNNQTPQVQRRGSGQSGPGLHAHHLLPPTAGHAVDLSKGTSSKLTSQGSISGRPARLSHRGLQWLHPTTPKETGLLTTTGTSASLTSQTSPKLDLNC